MRYRPRAPLMYTESEMQWEVARMAAQLLVNRVKYGRFLDILVTHSPPYRIHDRPDRAHTGFRIFEWLVRTFRPRYMLHGHIHVYRRTTPTVTRLGETTIINVYPYRLLDYDEPPRPHTREAKRWS